MIAILFDYIIPIIYDSFITLIIVLLILFIFRIKDSGIRILFFFLPLIKPFLVISERISYSPAVPSGNAFNSGIRIPDTNNLFRWFDQYEYDGDS